MINIDHTYRITAVLKVKTDIITSIKASSILDITLGRGMPIELAKKISDISGFCAI
jgi:hypothetical protein